MKNQNNIKAEGAFGTLLFDKNIIITAAPQGDSVCLLSIYEGNIKDKSLLKQVIANDQILNDKKALELLVLEAKPGYEFDYSFADRDYPRTESETVINY